MQDIKKHLNSKAGPDYTSSGQNILVWAGILGSGRNIQQLDRHSDPRLGWHIGSPAGLGPPPAWAATRLPLRLGCLPCQAPHPG
jgi:hypothetical protein